MVDVGCGLNTRFERVDNGRVRWFDLDLPDVIALRRRFFQDGPRQSMLAASIVDDAWIAPVKDAGGPWFFAIKAMIPTWSRRCPSSTGSDRAQLSPILCRTRHDGSLHRAESASP
jgi:hypothetical protein